MKTAVMNVIFAYTLETNSIATSLFQYSQK